MRLYAGSDLHSSNSYCGIEDENDKRVFQKKLANDPELIVNTLRPFKKDIVGKVVESTYNWYWQVDLLHPLIGKPAHSPQLHSRRPSSLRLPDNKRYSKRP